MKINLKQNILGIDDKPIISTQTNLPRTLKSVIIGALLFPKGRRNPQTGAIEQPEDTDKEKFEKYELYKRVKAVNIDVKNADTTIELTAEEISKIKKLIHEIEQQLVMGQCWEKLEGKDNLHVLK